MEESTQSNAEANTSEHWRVAAMSEARLPSTGELASALREKQFIFCLGMEKCGTTSLYEFFKSAAAVSVAKAKEVEFFSHNFDRGFDWYLSNFDLNKRVLLDATPTYHWLNAAMWRINQCCENVLITFMLRNPVDRAYSAYCHRAYWFFLSELQAGAPLDSFNLSISEFARLKDRNASGFQFIFASYLAAIDRVVGKHNASFDIKQFLPIIMERFVASPAELVHEIEQKSKVDLGVAPEQAVPRENSLCFPQFHRGTDLLEFPGAESVSIDPKSVYIRRNGQLTRVGDAESYTLFKLLERKWLEPLTEDDAQHIFENYYAAEVEEIERRFGLDLGLWRQITARSPRLCPRSLGSGTPPPN